MTSLQLIGILIGAAIALLGIVLKFLSDHPHKNQSIIIFIALGCLIISGAVVSFFLARQQQEYEDQERHDIAQISGNMENLPKAISRVLAPIIKEKLSDNLSAIGQMLSESSSSLEELLTSDEKRGYIHKRLGDCYYKEADLKNAETEFKMAIENNPADVDNYRYLGIIFSQQKRLSEAKSIYLKIISLEPGISTLEEQLQLALLYEYLGPDVPALQSALKLYNHIIKFNGAYVELAKSRIEYIKGQLGFEETRRSGELPVGLIPPVVVISYPSSESEFGVGEKIVFKGTIAAPYHGCALDYYVVEYRDTGQKGADWNTITHKQVDVVYQEGRYLTGHIVGDKICEWISETAGRYAVRVVAKDLNGQLSSHQIVLTIKERQITQT